MQFKKITLFTLFMIFLSFSASALKIPLKRKVASEQSEKLLSSLKSHDVKCSLLDSMNQKSFKTFLMKISAQEINDKNGRKITSMDFYETFFKNPKNECKLRFFIRNYPCSDGMSGQVMSDSIYEYFLDDVQLFIGAFDEEISAYYKGRDFSDAWACNEIQDMKSSFKYLFLDLPSFAKEKLNAKEYKKVKRRVKAAKESMNPKTGHSFEVLEEVYNNLSMIEE